jgi:hypothetical protein
VREGESERGGEGVHWVFFIADFAFFFFFAFFRLANGLTPSDVHPSQHQCDDEGRCD